MRRTPQKVPQQSHAHKHALEIFESVLAETPLVMFDVDQKPLWDSTVRNWQRVQLTAKTKEPWDITKEFQERITVNFLRHRRTNYDELRKLFLEGLYGSRMQFLLHTLLKCAVLDLIAERFPQYAQECQHQRSTSQPQHRRK